MLPMGGSKVFAVSGVDGLNAGDRREGPATGIQTLSVHGAAQTYTTGMLRGINPR